MSGGLKGRPILTRNMPYDLIEDGFDGLVCSVLT
jgi:hypothetical protein